MTCDVLTDLKIVTKAE